MGSLKKDLKNRFGGGGNCFGPGGKCAKHIDRNVMDYCCHGHSEHAGFFPESIECMGPELQSNKAF